MKKQSRYLINILWSEEDQLYIAEVPELEGCITHGRSAAQAARNADAAVESWMRTARRLKHPIPEPVARRKTSGKFNVRIPKQLHKSLVIKAAQEGVSLNHLVTSCLSRAA